VRSYRETLTPLPGADNSMNQAIKNYHHGNLRNALITSAARIIEAQGSLEFSITDAARQAGVSVGAPYRHFNDKEDLLRSVRDLAFIGLAETVEHTLQRDEFPAGSVTMIVALGHSYLAYAREKRAFFSLMWEDRGDTEERRLVAHQKRSGFDGLADSVAAYCDQITPLATGAPRSGDDPMALSVATQLWAVAHGIATLEHNGMLDLFNQASTAEQVLEASTRALLKGLRVDHSGAELSDG